MEACLRPANTIHYKSPLTNKFVFLDRIEKGKDGLEDLYHLVNVTASFLIPQPKVPRALLAPEIISSPLENLPKGLVNALRELPRVATMVTGAISLSIVFPLFGLCLLTCRCCCGACGGRNQYPKRCDCCWRCICFFSLGMCCALMTCLVAGAIITDMYTYAGVSLLPQYPKRVIQDLETGYLKTQSEIDALLLEDYAIFEKEMKERLDGSPESVKRQNYAIFEKERKEGVDGCSQAIGEDVEGILAVNPAPLAKKLVDHVLSMTKEAQELKKASDDYLAATSAVAMKTQFAPGKSPVGNVTVACSTSQTYVGQCDTIKKAREHLQKQTSQFSQLTNLGKDISNYSAMLQTLDAARFQPDIDKASNSMAKDDFMKATEKGIKDVKDTLQNFGDDLGDKANAFYIMPLEYPEDLVAASDRNIVGKYRKYRLFVLGFFGFNAAMAGLLLLCPTTLYFFGLVMVAWAPTQGCCNYRSGRWCFSLGAFAFVLIFGFAALLTTGGLLTSVVATRCGCALAADLQQPGIVAVVRYLVQLVEIYTDDDSMATELVSAVTIDYLTTIVKRFSACYTEPRSAYRLLGEPYVRNASKAIGYEKQLSFLWDGFEQKELDQRLQFIGGSLGSLVNLSALSVLASKLTPLLQFQLEALKIKEIEKEVGDINMQTEYADELKIALEVMEQHVASQTPLAKDLADAFKEVDDISSDLIHCDLKKNILQDSLKKMEALMEIDSKPVDLFKSETITDVGDTYKIQLAIDKATAQVKPYKDNIGHVVQHYREYVVNQMKDSVGNCAPAYTVYLSSVSVVCDGVVKPFSAFWFCLASLLAVGIVAMFMALCMSTLYSRKPQPILLRRTPVPPPKKMESFTVAVMQRETAVPQKPVASASELREDRKSSFSGDAIYISIYSDSSTSSCSCIFSDTSTFSPLATVVPRRSKNKKKKIEKRGSSSRKSMGQSTATGRYNKKGSQDDEVMDVKSGRKKKAMEKGKKMKGKTGKKMTQCMCKKTEVKGDSTEQEKTPPAATTLDDSIDIKLVLGDIQNEHKTKSKGQMKEEKKRDRRSQWSSNDVRVLLYDPPSSGFARALRDISRRVALASVGRSSSILRSISGSAHSLRTRLFERYQTVQDEVSSQVALER